MGFPVMASAACSSCCITSRMSGRCAGSSVSMARISARSCSTADSNEHGCRTVRSLQDTTDQHRWSPHLVEQCKHVLNRFV
jgi:hypothetical protein